MPQKMSRKTLVTRTYLDGKKENRPLSMPLLQATTFTGTSAKEHAELYQTKQSTFYQRFGHPNSEAVAEKIALLEGAEAAVAFSSGMAAISSVLLANAKAKKEIIISNQCFEQTERLLKHLKNQMGIKPVFVDTTDVSAVEAALTPDTSFIYLETPSNPHLRISDIAAILKTAKHIPVFVDSTFATPLGQNPLQLGASLVIHSGTKFLGGHHDVMSGFVAGSKKFLAPVREMQVLLGGVLDPHAAWLVARSLKTFGIRMEQIGKNALQIARFLQGSKVVRDVYYPMLEGSPGHEIAKRQMRHGGGVVAFRLHGGQQAARVLLDSLQLIHIASSLGGIETTIQISYEVDWYKKVANINQVDNFADPGMIRLSVGIEKGDDIVSDLKTGLKAASLQTAA